MFASILFPVDFSERCKQAATQVAGIAAQFGSKVTLIHAIGDYTHVFTPEAPSSFALREWLIEDAKPQIASFGSPVLDDFVIERLVEDGDPAEVIRRYATTHSVDLITLPTHGRGVFRQFLLGSVTAKVLHDCECPVWTTAHCDPSAATPFQVKTILCALGMSSSSESVFEEARKAAHAWGAEMRLIHAIPVPGAPLESLMNQSFANALAEIAEKQIAEMQRRFATNYPSSVATGDIAQVIREAATECQADLLVIGRGRVREHFGRLRSHTASIIRESPCPVLSF